MTDRGVSPHPRSSLFVVALVVGAHLVAFGLVFGFAEVAAHWLGCELSAGEAGSGDGWHGLGVGVGGFGVGGLVWLGCDGGWGGLPEIGLIE